MKNKVGVLAAAFYVFPLIWHHLRTQSLSILNSSQSTEGDMGEKTQINKNQSSFSPASPWAVSKTIVHISFSVNAKLKWQINGKLRELKKQQQQHNNDIYSTELT